MGKIHAIDIPTALPGGVRRILKILVFGLEKAVVEAIHLDSGYEVGAEDDAVREAQEEPPCRVGLPSQLRGACADIDQNIRIGVEHRCYALQILSVFSYMRGYEGGTRVSFED